MPTPKTARQTRKEATREALKAAALVLLKDDSSDPRIGAITKSAGVAHGTFYVHFESKEALLDELLDDLNAELSVAFAKDWAQAVARRGAAGSHPANSLPSSARNLTEGGLRDAIASTAALYLDFWRGHRGFIEVYARRAMAVPSVDQLAEGFSPGLGQALSAGLALLAGQRSVVLSPTRIALAAQGLLGMWLRVGLQYVFHTTIARDEAIDLLVDLTSGALNGLLARAPGNTREPS